jgi:hypothetical protein
MNSSVRATRWRGKVALPAGAAKRSPHDSPFADREPARRGAFLPSAEPTPRPRLPGAGYPQSTMPCQGRAGGRAWRRGRACLGLDRHGMLPDPARTARAYLSRCRYGVRYHPQSAGNGSAGSHGSASTALLAMTTRSSYSLSSFCYRCKESIATPSHIAKMG